MDDESKATMWDIVVVKLPMSKTKSQVSWGHTDKKIMMLLNHDDDTPDYHDTNAINEHSDRDAKKKQFELHRYKFGHRKFAPKTRELRPSLIRDKAA